VSELGLQPREVRNQSDRLPAENSYSWYFGKEKQAAALSFLLPALAFFFVVNTQLAWQSEIATPV
jgi:hypothetical protein